MFWFIFSIIVLCLAHFGDAKVAKDGNLRAFARVLLVLVLSYVIILCSTSTDQESYLSKYSLETIDFSWGSILEWLSFSSDESEIGFVIIRNICKLLGFSGIGFLFIISIITNSIFVNYFYKFRYPVFVFFLYIMSIDYLQESNIVRQMFAVSIGFISIKYLSKRDWKRFLLIIFLAFTIHRSSIILLLATPVLFIQDLNFKTIKYFFFVLWAASLMMVFIHIPILEQYSLLVEGTKYATYADERVTLGLNESSFNYVYNFLVLIFFLFFKDTKYLVPAFWFLMGVVIQNASFNAILLQRVAFFFTPMFCAFAPTLLYENNLSGKSSGNPLKYVLPVLVFLFYFRILFLHYIMGGITNVGNNITSISEIF